MAAARQLAEAWAGLILRMIKDQEIPGGLTLLLFPAPHQKQLGTTQALLAADDLPLFSMPCLYTNQLKCCRHSLLMSLLCTVKSSTNFTLLGFECRDYMLNVLPQGHYMMLAHSALNAQMCIGGACKAAKDNCWCGAVSIYLHLVSGMSSIAVSDSMCFCLEMAAQHMLSVRKNTC